MTPEENTVMIWEVPVNPHPDQKLDDGWAVWDGHSYIYMSEEVYQRLQKMMIETIKLP